MSTLLLYTCEKAVCLWLWGDDDRDASHHGLHAKHRRCTDHPCASPPPAGGLQNDTFLKAQLSKVWDEITSILFLFFSRGVSRSAAALTMPHKSEMQSICFFFFLFRSLFLKNE